LHRTDLNAIEKAEACARLVRDFKLNQTDAAKKLGKSRSTLANLLRLLDLPDDVKEQIGKGEVSAGHAKALLMLATPKEQSALCKRIVAHGLSVRETERIAGEKTKGPPGSRARTRSKKAEKPSYLVDLEDRLRQKLGTRVTIQEKGEGGRLVIEFYSADDFQRLLGLLEKA
jgi:ParB family chromosome partitioning protein